MLIKHLETTNLLVSYSIICGRHIEDLIFKCEILSKECKLCNKTKEKLKNKPICKPIRSVKFLVHIQCDLVYFRNTACSLLGETYKWLLVVKDLFTKFIWVEPLESKKGTEVSYAIYKILLQFPIFPKKL